MVKQMATMTDKVIVTCDDESATCSNMILKKSFFFLLF